MHPFTLNLGNHNMCIVFQVVLRMEHWNIESGQGQPTPYISLGFIFPSAVRLGVTKREGFPQILTQHKVDPEAT